MSYQPITRRLTFSTLQSVCTCAQDSVVLLRISGAALGATFQAFPANELRPPERQIEEKLEESDQID